MNTKVKILLVILALTIIAFVISGQLISLRNSSPKKINNPDKKETEEGKIRSVSLNKGIASSLRSSQRQSNLSDKAPEISNNGVWINTEKALTEEDLKGKVVLVQFWTFGCYNCKNTLPYIKDWYKKYYSDKFEIIGVHCPEFDNERDVENVKEFVKENEIKYPVLTDNAFTVWEKFDVHAWPTLFLIDKNGEIRYSKVGEGKYEKTEQMINELLSD